MTIPLLTTKLYIPPVRSVLVDRPRLIDMLDAGLKDGLRLTLVSAPAGFGKTTLVSGWVSGTGRSVAWITLDENDNDSLRFLTYLISALRNIDAKIGEGIFEAIQSSNPSPIESVIMALVNQIASISEPFILVFDDYHFIEEQSIHNMVNFLIEYTPDQMHLVVVSRGETKLPVARLRGRGFVTELGQEDLRFTQEEVSEFLNRVMGLTLRESDMDTLTFQTEGWIAGLLMIALVIRGQIAHKADDYPAHKFVLSLLERDRYVLEYLIEEVLENQPEAIKNFLLFTSVIDRMCGPICDAILGEEGLQAIVDAQLVDQVDSISVKSSQHVLEYLDHDNLFIVPLDAKREWYRYHRLFADVLRVRLVKMYPDLKPQLHERASIWFEKHGFLDLSIEQAISANDFSRAGRLIEDVAVGKLSRGEITILMNWLEALPDGIKVQHPILFLYQAWVMFVKDCPIDDVESKLEDAMRADKDNNILAEISMFQATLASVKGDIDGSIDLSKRALNLFPENRYFFRGVTVRSLATAYEDAGDLLAAINTFDEAVKMDNRAGNLVGVVTGLSKLAGLRIIQGRLQEAQELYQRAIHVTQDKRGSPIPAAGRALIGLGELQREWNELESAQRSIEEGIVLVQRWSNAWAIGGFKTLALVKYSLGDHDGAIQAIRKAADLAIAFDASEMDDFEVTLAELYLWMMSGNCRAASLWFQEHQVNDQIRDIPVPFALRERRQLLHAWVNIEEGNFNLASEILESIQQEAEKHGRTGVLLDVLILNALLAQAMDHIELCRDLFDRALSLAEPEEYVRKFIDHGQPIAKMLYDAVSRKYLPDYVGRLLVEYERYGEFNEFPQLDTYPSEVRYREIITALSDRELEVLSLIGEGLSNQEIAQQLYITLRTVKWHTGNIFHKLGVKNRTQAVSQARKIGIL